MAGVSEAHSTGEWAGIASAVVLLLGVVGSGIAWLAKWRGEVRRTRSQGLQEWEDKLSAREDELDAKLEGRFAAIESENRQRQTENVALRMAFELVAGALRAIDPDNTALNRAEQLLVKAFPLSVGVPPEMALLIQQVERRDHATTASGRRTETP